MQLKLRYILNYFPKQVPSKFCSTQKVSKGIKSIYQETMLRSKNLISTNKEQLTALKYHFYALLAER